MMLGDLGARVIKVERPEHGDEARSWGPPFVGPPDARESTYFLCCNRNKESIVLDLTTREGVHILQGIIRRADVLVENFRPGVLDRMGLTETFVRELNPRLVVLSITGFGHTGPESARAGYDQIAQAEGGLMSLTGFSAEEPVKVGVPIADLLAGMYGAYGVLAALHERERTGRGKVVRTSLLAAVVGCHAYAGTAWTVARHLMRAAGNHHPSIAPYGTFRCREGFVQICVGNEDLWRQFAPLVGIDPADERYKSNAQRVERRSELTERIERALRGGKARDWVARLSAAGVPCGEVRTLDQVYGSAQVRSQCLVTEVDHAILGRIEIPACPVTFDGAPPRDHAAPPAFGQHDEEVRLWLRETEGAQGSS
jgi:crotonobetainyl-CoA:carnitine CoA-transferase CaiB-like acyl-CoA transferase